MDRYYGDNIESTKIFRIIFSQKNIDKLQEKIITLIKQTHNYVITKQSPEILKIIMTKIYNNIVTYNYKDKYELLEESKKINKAIIDYCFNDIINNIKTNNIYLNDINNDFCYKQVIPWDTYGQNVNKKGENSLELTYNNL